MISVSENDTLSVSNCHIIAWVRLNTDSEPAALDLDITDIDKVRALVGVFQVITGKSAL